MMAAKMRGPGRLSPLVIRSSFVVAALVSAACSSDHAMNMDHVGAEHGDAGSAPPMSEAIPTITHDALFVVNGGDATISVVNTETAELAGTIRLMDAMYPHHLYLSADRAKLALAIPGMDLTGGHAGAMHAAMGAVLVTDATTGRTLKARTLDAMNHNANFAPTSGEVWTSQMTAPGAVLVLDSTSLETLQTIPVGDRPAEVTFSSDGKYAFVANGASSTVTVIDAATKMVVKTIAVGENPVGAWQGSNGIAYVDNEKAMTISAIDTKTLEVKTTYNLGFMPGMVALAPDASLWVTDADNGKLVVNMTDMDMRLADVATGTGAHAIAFSGDGKTGYVSNQMANTVSVIDVMGRAVLKTITVGAKPNGMVWRAK